MHCLRTKLHEIEKKILLVLSIWFLSYHCILFSRVECNTTQFNFMQHTQYHSIWFFLIGFTLSIINFLSCFMFFPNFSSTIDIFILNFTLCDPVFVSFLFRFCFYLCFYCCLIFLSLKSEILPHLNLSYWILFYLFVSNFILFYLFVSNFILFYIILLHDLIHLINCTLIYFLDSIICIGPLWKSLPLVCLSCKYILEHVRDPELELILLWNILLEKLVRHHRGKNSLFCVL